MPRTITAWLQRWLAAWRGWQAMPSPADAPAMSPAATATPALPKSAAPNEVFTPTRPRAGRRALVGRSVELARILQALGDEAAHVVLYAERGRGKTSLANLSVERLRRMGVIVGRHACDASSDFDQIIRGLLRDLPPSLMGQSDSGHEAGEGCEAILPHRRLMPADVAAIPSRLACPQLVFVVDEFDRVQDAETRTRLADTIKLLSDRGVKLLFMIVGVSTTLDRILGQHPSIQRNIAAVHLPLLQDDEIVEMLVRGGQAAGVAFTPAACEAVVGVSRGMPYMAQLMGLRIAQGAVLRWAPETSPADLAAALERLLAEAASEVAGRYTMLLARGGDMAYDLWRIASATQDRWGRLLPPITEDPSAHRLMAEGLLEPCAGMPAALQPSDRALMYHVLLLAARDGAPVLSAASGTAGASARPAGALRSVAAAGR